MLLMVFAVAVPCPQLVSPQTSPTAAAVMVPPPVTGSVSSSSVLPEQPLSARSMKPSLSLSLPSAHCFGGGGGVVPGLSTVTQSMSTFVTDDDGGTLVAFVRVSD